jgi:DNA polymerase
VSGASDPDATRELSELAGAVRAHVEWLVASGATGLPRGERSGAATQGNAPPSVVAQAVVPAVARAAAPALVVGTSPVVTGALPAVSAASGPAAGAIQAELLSAPGAPAGSKPVGLELDERRRRLDVLAEGVRGCTRCALHAGRTQTVFARGTGSSGLCFVGEGPGADEDAQGFPFVGKAGQLLDRMIEAMGFARDDVYVCNIVKCRPPNNRKPEPEEMATCMPYLREQLELVAPEVIVALGATAVQGLFGTSEGITRLRGRWKLYGGRIPVMPTFHPAFLLRNPPAKREVWDDLQAVLRQMGRQPPKR